MSLLLHRLELSREFFTTTLKPPEVFVLIRLSVIVLTFYLLFLHVYLHCWNLHILMDCPMDRDLLLRRWCLCFVVEEAARSARGAPGHSPTSRHHCFNVTATPETFTPVLRKAPANDSVPFLPASPSPSASADDILARLAGMVVVVKATASVLKRAAFRSRARGASASRRCWRRPSVKREAAGPTAKPEGAVFTGRNV